MSTWWWRRWSCGIPLAADTGRFAADTSVAASGTGFGFGVGSAGAVMVGGLAGLTRVIEPSFSGVTGALLATGSTLVILVVVIGVLLAQLEQPFGLIYGAATSVSSTVLRRPPGFLGEGLVVAAAAAAILVTESSLSRAVDFLAAIVAPMVAIFIADFYVVRQRRYLTDGLYDRSGPYRGVNLLGLATFLVAFGLMQWIEPSGPDPVGRGDQRSGPGGRELGHERRALGDAGDGGGVCHLRRCGPVAIPRGRAGVVGSPPDLRDQVPASPRAAARQLDTRASETSAALASAASVANAISSNDLIPAACSRSA